MKDLYNMELWASMLQVMNRGTKVRKQSSVCLERKECAHFPPDHRLYQPPILLTASLPPARPLLTPSSSPSNRLNVNVNMSLPCSKPFAARMRVRIFSMSFKALTQLLPISQASYVPSSPLLCTTQPALHP